MVAQFANGWVYGQAESKKKKGLRVPLFKLSGDQSRFVYLAFLQ